MKNCFKKSVKIRAQSTLEFLAVFIILFVFFIGITDIALFFRQIYLVQTISDEALARLETARRCDEDLDASADTLASVISYYYGITPGFEIEQANGFYKYTSEKYSFILSCRNSTTPDSLAFVYTYSGIFFFINGRQVSSNFSSNTTYF